MKPKHHNRHSRQQHKSGLRHPASAMRQAAIATVSSANLIMGRNCLREVLRYKPKILKKVLCALEPETLQGSAADIVSLIESNGLAIEMLSPQVLSDFVGSTSHQGFAGIIQDRAHEEFKHFLERKGPETSSAVMCLDGISDPQNFGAALRAAECFGFDAVVWSRNRGVGITPVVSKASVGASELVTTIPVANLVEALRKLKDQQYWVVAADADPQATPLPRFEFPNKFALLMGAEGDGISRLALEQADYRVYIPLAGRIKSLNVSQAIAIFMASARLGQ